MRGSEKAGFNKGDKKKEKSLGVIKMVRKHGKKRQVNSKKGKARKGPKNQIQEQRRSEFEKKGKSTEHAKQRASKRGRESEQGGRGGGGGKGGWKGNKPRHTKIASSFETRPGVQGEDLLMKLTTLEK